MCAITLDETGRREIILTTDYAKYFETHTAQEWMSKLGRRRLATITNNSRILIPVHDRGHYSLIDIDLRSRSVEHLDSLGSHNSNEKWIKTAKNIAEALLIHIRAEERRVKPHRTRRSFRTQRGGSNTCMIHVYQYMRSIMLTGRAVPMADDQAVEMRTELAGLLKDEMQQITR